MEVIIEGKTLDPEDYEIVNGEVVFKNKYLTHAEFRCIEDCPYCKMDLPDKFSDLSV